MAICGREVMINHGVWGHPIFSTLSHQIPNSWWIYPAISPWYPHDIPINSLFLYPCIVYIHKSYGQIWIIYGNLSTNNEKNWNIPLSSPTAGARIIERSQEYKSTVKYRTFVLLRVPIPRRVGKFNYRTGIRSIIKFPRSIIKLLLAPIYNFWHWHDIYCIFVHIQSIKWRFNE